jgi:Tfp pilus assembly protein PilV
MDTLLAYQHNNGHTISIPAQQWTHYQHTSTTMDTLSAYQHNKHAQISATQIPESHANKTAAERKARVADIHEVTILQEFLPNKTRAFLFSRTRVTGVARYHLADLTVNRLWRE